MLVFITVIFINTSLITLLLSIREIPVSFMQQVILVILLFLTLLSKKLFSYDSSVLTKILRLSGVFFSSLLTQLFVFSTGGLYSPFIILIHLYTLFVSLLFGYIAGMIFIFLSVSSLIFASYVNPRNLNIFRNDPATGIMYMISFVVVVPLAQLLVKHFQLKDTLSKILGRYLKLNESREESIIKNLSELFIVTDRDLKIISINNAVEKIFKVDPFDIKNKDLLELMHLTNSSGDRITKEALEIDKVLNNKSTYFIKDLSLRTPSKIFGNVVVQVTPILDIGGDVEQITFVITEAKLSNEIKKHIGLEEALERHKIIGENLRKSLLTIKQPELVKYAELFAKGEEDLIELTELEDHPINQILSVLDLALICQRIIEEKSEFANSFNVPIRCSLPEEDKAELIIFNMSEGKDVASDAWNFSNFAAPIDNKWFSLIIEKLIDLSILLSSSYSTPGVVLSLSRDDKEVSIRIIVNYAKLFDQNLDDLFRQYYGSLGQTTSLRLGNGLEGFIAKAVSDELNIALALESKDEAGQIIFTIKLPKYLS